MGGELRECKKSHNHQNATCAGVAPALGSQELFLLMEPFDTYTKAYTPNDPEPEKGVVTNVLQDDVQHSKGELYFVS